MIYCFFFFFSSRRRHTRWTGDWSSDVCSSDLAMLVERVQHPTVCRVFRGRAHRELVAVRLPRDQRARRLELRDGGGLVGGAVALEDLGAAGRREFEGADVVLHGDRHAIEDAGRVGGLRLLVQRLPQLLRRGQHRVEALGLDDAVGRRLGARERLRRIAHSAPGASPNWPSFGTRKNPSLKAGASFWGPNVSGQGLTSSGRKRAASGPGTKGRAPSLAATAPICAT